MISQYHVSLPNIAIINKPDKRYLHQETQPSKVEDSYSFVYYSIGGNPFSGRQIRWQDLTLPEHPNQFSFLVTPGLNESIEMVYQKTPDDLPLKLQVLDAEDSSPIVEYEGVVSAYAGTWVDDVSYDFIQVVKYMANHDASPIIKVHHKSGIWETPDICQHWKKSDVDYVDVALQAKGYVQQSFRLPLEMIRGAEVIELRMQKEASVKGRLFFGPTKEPLTVDALKEFFGKGRDSDEIKVTIKKASEKVRLMTSSNFPQKASTGSVRPDDGIFSFHHLPPNEKWNLVIEAPSLPDYHQQVLLSKGENNLGDILLYPSGNLKGKVLDISGNPMPGVIFKFPINHPGTLNRLRSDLAGEYQIDLIDSPGKNQLIRMIPPWGQVDRHWPEAFYDVIIPVSPSSENTCNFMLPKGNDLTVTIPMNEKYNYLKERYSFSETHTDLYGDKIGLIPAQRWCLLLGYIRGPKTGWRF